MINVKKEIAKMKAALQRVAQANRALKESERKDWEALAKMVVNFIPLLAMFEAAGQDTTTAQEKLRSIVCAKDLNEAGVHLDALMKMSGFSNVVEMLQPG